MYISYRIDIRLGFVKPVIPKEISAHLLLGEGKAQAANGMQG